MKYIAKLQPNQKIGSSDYQQLIFDITDGDAIKATLQGRIAQLSLDHDMEFIVNVNDAEKLKTLINFGIEIDFSEASQLVAEARAEIEKEETRISEERLRKNYECSWVHNFAPFAESYKIEIIPFERFKSCWQAWVMVNGIEINMINNAYRINGTRYSSKTVEGILMKMQTQTSIKANAEAYQARQKSLQAETEGKVLRLIDSYIGLPASFEDEYTFNAFNKKYTSRRQLKITVQGDLKIHATLIGEDELSINGLPKVSLNDASAILAILNK